MMCPGSRVCPLPLAQQRRLVPTLQMSSRLKGEARGSCGPLRRKLKGLAQGLTQILDN